MKTTRKRMTRTAFARQMRPVATRRSSRASRDADNPRMGEIYETRGGSRWQVVSTSDKLITVKRAGHRTEGPYAWGKESLKGMKQVPRPLFGVGGLFGIGATKPANETEARDPERRKRLRDPMSSIGKTLDPTWKRRSPRRQWGVFLEGKPYAWYGDKGQAVEAAKELRRAKNRGDDGKPLLVDVRSTTAKTARLGYFYKRKGHGRQKESKFGTTKYLHGHRYKYGEPYAFPGRRRKKNYAEKEWTRRDAGFYGSRDPARKRKPAKRITRKTKPKTRAKRTASAPRKRGRTPKSEGAHCSGAPILARKARKVEPPHTCPSATKVQSLVFERWCWTLARAKSWAQRHGYKTEVDTSERYYRFRQLPPKTYKPVGTVPFMRGLNAIMGCTRIAKKRKKS